MRIQAALKNNRGGDRLESIAAGFTRRAQAARRRSGAEAAATAPFSFSARASMAKFAAIKPPMQTPAESPNTTDASSAKPPSANASEAATQVIAAAKTAPTRAP